MGEGDLPVDDFLSQHDRRGMPVWLVVAQLAFLSGCGPARLPVGLDNPRGF